MNRFSVIPVFLASALCVLTACSLMSNFSLNLIFPASRSEAYDALAQSLTRFDVEVHMRRPWGDIDWIEGRPVMYFGLLPALPRIVLNALFPTGYGLWGALSCFAGYLAALLAIGLITAEALLRNKNLNAAMRSSAMALVICGTGLGTPLLFLASRACIWHESLLWGLAFSLGGMFGILRYLEQRSAGALLLLSFCCALTLHARATLAIPLFLILPVFTLDFLLAGNPGTREIPAFHLPEPKRFRTALVILLPAVLGLLLQGWYNYMRFGSALSILASPVNREEEFPLFALSRVPVTFSIYFSWFALSITRAFPFLHPVMGHQFATALIDRFPDHAIWLQRNAGPDALFPFSLSSCWLVLLILPFMLHFLRQCRRRLALWVTFSLFAHWLVVLSYFYLAIRFTSEFIPLGIFALAITLRRVRPQSLSTRRLLVCTVPVAASICITILTILSWKANDFGTFRGQTHVYNEIIVKINNGLRSVHLLD